MRDHFSRSEALLGAAAMRRLAAARVLVVGVGGVGSWCAEALVRTGVGHVTLVDDDVVAESNVNRQCPAMPATVGRAKVAAMAERLKAINPDGGVEAVNARYPSSSVSCLKSFSLVVDAIDSVDCKAELILVATEAGVPLVSSMGAALRVDPTKVRVTRFEKVEGDGLARALRQRFRRLGRYPKGRFSCVWSAETPVGRPGPDFRNRQETGGALVCDCGAQGTARPTMRDSLAQGTVAGNPPTAGCRAAKGSLMPVTATFGMCLASEAIKILTKGETR